MSSRCAVVLVVMILYAFIAPSTWAESSKTRFKTVTSRGDRVVVEGETASLKVGDVLTDSSGKISAKVVQIKAGMAILQAGSNAVVEEGAEFSLTDPIAEKKRRAESLLDESPATSPAAAMAVETPIESRDEGRPDIRNFAFMPSKGAFTLEASLDFAVESYDLKNSSGAKFETDDYTGVDLPVLVGFGISDRLTLGIQEDLRIRGETRSEPTGSAVTSYNREGLGDPELGLRYRLYDEPAKGALGRLTFSISPPVQKNRAPDTASKKSGNNGRGGTAVHLTSDFAWRKGPHEWMPSLALQYLSKRTVHGVSSDSTLDSQFNAVIAAAYRFHATDRLFLEPGVLLAFPFTETQDSGGTIASIDHPFSAGVYAKVGVSLSESSLLFLSLDLAGYSADASVQSGSTVSHGSVSYSHFGGSLGYQYGI